MAAEAGAAVGSEGAVVGRYPATTGSEHDPLPLGEWKVNGVARDPSFNYNPDLFWDADPGPCRSIKIVLLYNKR